MKYATNRNSSCEEVELPADEIRKKILQYSTFVDKVLQPQLQSAVKHRENVEGEIAEYEELLDRLIAILNRRSKGKDEGDHAGHEVHQPLEAIVDLGHQVSYCKAEVQDPHTVYVHVGMGFHIEFTLPEATKFVERRIKFLRFDVLPKKAQRAKDVASDVEDALSSLEALCQELREDEGGKTAK